MIYGNVVICLKGLSDLFKKFSAGLPAPYFCSQGTVKSESYMLGTLYSIFPEHCPHRTQPCMTVFVGMGMDSRITQTV